LFLKHDGGLDLDFGRVIAIGNGPPQHGAKHFLFSVPVLGLDAPRQTGGTGEARRTVGRTGG
jgi:hypothetical protein